MQLGTIGLGRMGANMARRLLAAGHRKGLFAPTGVGAACMRVRVGNAIGVGLTEAVLRGDREMPTRTERTHQVTQIEVILETSHADFTRAFESLLGRMPVGGPRRPSLAVTRGGSRGSPGAPEPNRASAEVSEHTQVNVREHTCRARRGAQFVVTTASPFVEVECDVRLEHATLSADDQTINGRRALRSAAAWR